MSPYERLMLKGLLIVVAAVARSGEEAKSFRKELERAGVW